MSQKWNLQDIRPANSHKATQRPQNIRQESNETVTNRPRPASPRREVIDQDLATIDIIDGNSQKRKRVIITAIITVLILGLGYVISTVLSGADITVHPMTKDVLVQSEITAYSQPQPNELSYEILSLDASSEKQVKATGKQNVKMQASGKIFVYNTKSTAPQKLVANTRFEDSNGHIFRIKTPIEVPGATKDAQGQFVPGKVTAEVFADEPGEQYNIKPTRFTLPGLKGSEQFDNVYGESTSDFTGGFNGEKYIIDDAELQTAQQQLHLELRDTLLKQMKEKIPSGFTLYENIVTFVYETLPATEYGDSLATIKEHAVLHIPIFKNDEFASFIAKKAVPNYSGEPVYLDNPQTLNVSYTDQTVPQSDISQLPQLTFTVTGNTKIIWKFDEAKLKNDLLGIKKGDALSVLSKYTSIANGRSEVRPFWAKTLPTNPDKIVITTVLE